MQKVILDSISLFFTLVVFGYASLLDYKHREVTNKLWVIGCVFSIPFLFNHLLIFNTILSIIVPCVFALVLWYFGAFGGADSKALITLSLLIPMGFDDSIPYFSLVCFMFACVLAMPYCLFSIFKKENLKKLEIPLLVYLFFGILVSLFVGKWFIELIL